jgi:hypothetical protein
MPGFLLNLLRLLTGNLRCQVYAENQVIDIIQEKLKEKYDQIKKVLMASNVSESDTAMIIVNRLKVLYIFNQFLMQNGLAEKQFHTFVCDKEYINHKNKDDLSALMSAFKREDMESCRLLLDAGADVNDLDDARLLVDEQTWSELNKSKGLEVLKFHGWENWTPLLVAVVQGTDHVLQYFHSLRTRVRLIYDCMAKKNPFPAWFLKKMSFYSVVRESSWGWRTFKSSGMVLSKGERKVARVNDNFDYSCAFGSKAMSHGTYFWTIKLEYAKSAMVWLGIAQGTWDEKSNSRPSLYENRILVFGNDGSVFHSEMSKKLELERHWNTKFVSGQIIGFMLDIPAKTLEMRIDGRLVASVYKVKAVKPQERDYLRPYVCMGYRESATLLSQHFIDGSYESVSETHEVQDGPWDIKIMDVIEATSKYETGDATITSIIVLWP